MDKKIEYPKPEGLRNTLLITYYGLEAEIAKARTAEDFITLLNKISMVGKSAAEVAVELGREKRQIAPINENVKKWR